jgi:outer membrane protein assembly factor BamB
VYIVASDGMLYTAGLPSSKDIQKPAAFVPANANLSDPIVVNDVLYASTSGNCGGAPNAVWAMDLSGDARPVVSWKTNGGGPVGSVAFTSSGAVLVALGAGQTSSGGYANAIVALDPKTLQPKDWFTAPNATFVTGPVVLHRNDKDVVAAATKDGRVLLLDAASLGGANHSTPMYASQPIVTAPSTFASAILATWQQMIPAATGAAAPAAAGAGAGGAPPAATLQPGQEWLLASTSTGVTALKVADDGGRVSIQTGWTAKTATSPTAPIVVNDVVFVASAGRAPSTGAVLYALNGTTGAELWNSGAKIASPMSPRSFWTGSSQVYAGAIDGTVYAFGYPMERK